MTDDQIVLALIAAYKARGADMSYLLSDPLFEKLPASVKIRAVKQHASELEQGISHNLLPVDKATIVSNTLFGAAGGVTTGMLTGAAISSLKGPGGLSTPTTALIGAGIMGLGGAITGAIGSLGGVGTRRTLKSSLKAVSEAPSDINAVGALSTSHLGSEMTSLKRQILDRVGQQITKNFEARVAPFTSSVDDNYRARNLNVSA
jgi:hypothetical protein